MPVGSIEQHTVRFLATEGEAVAANFDLQGITEGSPAEKLDTSSRQQAHFLQAQAFPIDGGKRTNGAGLPGFEVTQFSHGVDNTGGTVAG